MEAGLSLAELRKLALRAEAVVEKGARMWLAKGVGAGPGRGQPPHPAEVLACWHQCRRLPANRASLKYLPTNICSVLRQNLVAARAARVPAGAPADDGAPAAALPGAVATTTPGATCRSALSDALALEGLQPQSPLTPPAPASPVCAAAARSMPRSMLTEALRAAALAGPAPAMN